MSAKRAEETMNGRSESIWIDGQGAWRIHRSPGERPGLFALHGFTGSGEDLLPLAPLIGRAMVAPDLPGHAGTTPLGSWPMTRIVEALGALCDTVEDRPGILMGYSLGGRTALQLAVTRPSRFSALVLVSSTAGIEDPEERRARRGADEALATRIETDGVEAFLDFWASMPIIATQQHIRSDWRTAMLMRRRAQTARGLACSLREVGAGTMPPIWDRLSSLSIPTLLLVGEADRKYCALAHRLSETLPHAECVRIAGAGHCVHLEAPEASATAIRTFLDEHS